MIDGAVRQGQTPVLGLTREDFLLLDNGVPQRILEVASGGVRLRIAVVLDASHSMKGGLRESLAQMTAAVTVAAHRDEPVDPIRLASTVARVASVTEAIAPLPVDRGSPGLLDGLAAVLSGGAAPGYRWLVIVLTDGVDTSSLLLPSVVTAIADRSDVVLQVVAITGAAVAVGAGRVLRATRAHCRAERRRLS